MAKVIKMTNPKTNETKNIKLGWSWILFLFSGFFGIPLFLRKLNKLGMIFFVFCVTIFILPPELMNVVSFVLMCLQIWVSIKGNEITIKNYLKLGWEFSEPDSEETKFAIKKLGIKNTAISSVS